MYIPVAQRKKVIEPQIGAYIPVAERKPAIQFSGEDLGIPSPFGRIQTSTPQFLSPDFPTPQKILGTLGREVGQSIARNIGSAALSFSTPKASKVAEPLKAEDFQSFLAQGLFETVFGKGAEIKPIETRIAEAEPKIKEWQKGIQTTLDTTPNLNARERFVLKTLANLNPKSTAFVGIMGSVGLDLTPFGGLEKNVFKQITKVRTIGEGLILGRKLGIADDLLENFTQQAVKVGNDIDAEKLFKSIANLQQTTTFKAPETTRAYTPVAERQGAKLTPRAQEAQKYGSALYRGTTLSEWEAIKALPKSYIPVAERESEFITSPRSITSIKSPSDLVAGRIEPSGETILTSKEPSLVRSTSQTLFSNRISFLREFSIRDTDSIANYLKVN